jgi:outer membrane receptor protein involved in Fe transport
MGSLTGTIRDDSNNESIEFATVAIYSSTDSALIDGTITDATGQFTIEAVPFGNYYVDIRFIGYTNTRITNVKVAEANPVIDLGMVNLEMATANINEVEVVAERSQVEYKIDRKVVNVSKNLTSLGGTAVDALQNTPSIQTEIDGTITLRGSSSFTVLVDGKPSVLQGSEALQQIPAASIDRIEIITNPSAKYDPEGTSGIINVIMKKEHRDGLNGIVNASATSLGQYSGDFLLNYRTGKFNIFGGIDYNTRPGPGSFKNLRETYYPDTTIILESQGDRSWNRGGTVLRGGVEYFINDRNNLTLSGNLGNRKFGIDALSKFHAYTDPMTIDEYYIQNNDFQVNNEYYSMTFNYQLKFEREGHELLAEAFYSGNRGNDTQELTDYTTDASWNIIDGSSSRDRSLETSDEKDLRIKVDYTLPVASNGRFEAGLQSRFDLGVGDYRLERYDPDANDWITDESLSSATEFSRSIQSAYATYSQEFTSLSFLGGLRTEYTDRIITQLTLEEQYRVKRWDFFPSVFLTAKLPANQQIQASYSRRINRPRSWYLDPFPRFFDPYNVMIGNPGLEPEYIGAFELNYQIKIDKSMIALEGYYRQTNNKISRIRTLGPDNILTMTFANLEKDFATGAELMGNTNPAKWWNLMVSGNLYYYNLNTENIDGGSIRSTTAWNVRTSNTFKLKWGTSIQLMSMYNGPSITAQGEREGFFMTNIGIRQDLLKRKISLTLNVRDVFASSKYAYTSEGADFYVRNESVRKSPSIGLTLSYKINNYNQRKQNDMNEMEFQGGF